MITISMKLKNKADREEIDGIKEQICDHYCRFPEGYGDKEDDQDRMWIERCQFCPLNKL